MFPRIYLALDNCFASKRWTQPHEWMQIAREAGVFAIEASADNECDPLYNTPETLNDWLKAVESATEQSGVRVVNLYSGHGTYATLGLAHHDVRVRDHIQHHWLEPMIRSAHRLNAGLGFFCHAFAQSVLAEPSRYAAALDDLTRRLGELAQFAQRTGLNSLSVEQMYSPHQIPWTVRGTQDLLQTVYRQQHTPLYITLDTGHQVGQRRHLRPTLEAVQAELASRQQGKPSTGIWLGAHADSINDLDILIQSLDARPYLFAAAEDGDLYHWLRMLGSYSPIIHLQQTDGNASAHRPFNAQQNQTGIVTGEAVLQALYDGYRQPVHDGYPPRCTDLYLTLELFSGTAEHPTQIIRSIQDSVAYWRRFIPQDGLPLDQLINRLPASHPAAK